MAVLGAAALVMASACSGQARGENGVYEHEKPPFRATFPDTARVCPWRSIGGGNRGFSWIMEERPPTCGTYDYQPDASIGIWAETAISSAQVGSIWSLCHPDYPAADREGDLASLTFEGRLSAACVMKQDDRYVFVVTTRADPTEKLDLPAAHPGFVNLYSATLQTRAGRIDADLATFRTFLRQVKIEGATLPIEPPSLAERRFE